MRVLGIDYLGGSGESTGPAAGGAFPSLSSYDQAEALRALLDHLRIARLRAIVGASYGGMVALAFAERYPERVEQLLVISAADRTHPDGHRLAQRAAAHRALCAVGRTRRPRVWSWRARWRWRPIAAREEFAARFASSPRTEDGQFVFPVEEYLFARGRDYAARYRPESFLCLSESIDLHAVDAHADRRADHAGGGARGSAGAAGGHAALAARLPRARLHEISSPHGHDAFLKEAEALQADLRVPVWSSPE